MPSDGGDGEEAFHQLLAGLVWRRRGVEGHHGGPHSVGRLLWLTLPGGRHFPVGGVQGGGGLPPAGVVPPQCLVKAILKGAGPWGRLHRLLRGKVCCGSLGLCCLGLGLLRLLLLLLAPQQLVSSPSLSLLLQVTLPLLPTPVAAKLWRKSK